jgi:Protein of unknown function (DUF1207)
LSGLRRFGLAGGALLAALLFAPVGSAADRTPDDIFWQGYISAVLEQDLGWAPDSFEVQVRERSATIVIYGEAGDRRAQAERAFAHVRDLNQVRIIVSGGGRPGGDVPIILPVGDLFRPLVADPKQPQFFVSYLNQHTPTDHFRAASVGYGENFGLWRWPGVHPGEGWQLNFFGGLFAQFDLDAPSNDLINADYTVGFSVTHRTGNYSARARVYHQSSHLGDEFLLDHPNIVRINLSVEAVDALASYEWDHWRIYGGAGYLIGRDPPDLKPGYAEIGGEYRGERFLWGLGRLIAGYDVHSFQEEDWNTARSLKIGLELGEADAGRRHVRLMAEHYTGFSTFGQFFRTEIRYTGVGIYFGF